jgi:hypothetical protein
VTSNDEKIASIAKSLRSHLSAPQIKDLVSALSEPDKPKRLSEHDKCEALYRAYPRRVGKAAALKAISKALARVPFIDLMDAVCEYAASREGKDPNYTPHPATWFNEGRWEDERSEWHRPEGNGRTGKAPRKPGPGERFDPTAELGSL